MSGPTRTDPGDSRRRILDAAQELFAARGFDGTPTAAVAARAGVPKGLVFYYFPTKESLLTTLITERLPTHPGVDVAVLAAPGDPAHALIALDDALNRDDNPAIHDIVWHEAGTHPAIREQLRTLRMRLQSLTVEVLRASSPLTAPARVLESCASAWVSTMLAATHIDRFRGHDERAESMRAVANVVTAALAHPWLVQPWLTRPWLTRPWLVQPWFAHP